ncbi:MAG: hypothetical protein ACK4UJ_09860 [Leptonema sp. (in: bacteria)]
MINKIYKIFIIVFLLYCKKITIPELYEELPQKQVSNTNPICIVWEDTPLLNSNKFLKAYAISRLFYSRVENTTGSLREILERGLKKKFSKEYSVYFSMDSHCFCTIQIRILKNEALWFPPQEFIQNPTPIRKGVLQVEFLAEYVLSPLKIKNEFKREIKEFVLATEEYQSTERVLSFIYKEFIEEIEAKTKTCFL